MALSRVSTFLARPANFSPVSTILDIPGDFADDHPTTAQLVVEVAVSSAALDREYAFLYAEAAVQEYWIILGANRQVEVYRRPENGKYAEVRTFGAGDVIMMAGVPNVHITVAELFGD